MSDTPRLAKEIRITQHGFEVDGEEFPWFVAAGSVIAKMDRSQLPSVTFTLIAERVLVDDDRRTPAQIEQDAERKRQLDELAEANLELDRRRG